MGRRQARGGRISQWICNRRATQPPAHFHRNPLGRGQLAVFPRCSLLTYRSRHARRSRLEKQPTDLQRSICLFRGQDTSARFMSPSATGSGKAAPLRILIADDHPVVREGLVTILSLQDDLEVVGQACDGEEACRLYEQLRPDILILDLRMPKKDG